jgi:hypothetical protein
MENKQLLDILSGNLVANNNFLLLLSQLPPAAAAAQHSTAQHGQRGSSSADIHAPM